MRNETNPTETETMTDAMKICFTCMIDDLDTLEDRLFNLVDDDLFLEVASRLDEVESRVASLSQSLRFGIPDRESARAAL